MIVFHEFLIGETGMDWATFNWIPRTRTAMSFIGPQIPVHFLASANDVSDDDDDYMPSLPPDLAATRAQTDPSATNHRSVFRVTTLYVRSVEYKKRESPRSCITLHLSAHFPVPPTLRMASKW